MLRQSAAGFLFLLTAACSSSQPDTVTDGCPSGNTGAICDWEGPVTFERDAVHVAESAVYVSATLEWSPCTAEEKGHKERIFRVDEATGTTSVAELPAGATPIQSTPDVPVEITLDSGVIASIEARSSDSVTASELGIGELRKPAGQAVAITLPAVCEDL
jgi:hypothetical protein